MRCVFVCVIIRVSKEVHALTLDNERQKKMEKVETLWSWLVDAGIITDDLQLMTDINGFSIVWLDEVLYTYKNK